MSAGMCQITDLFCKSVLKLGTLRPTLWIAIFNNILLLLSVHFYEGESNENLKSAITIRNTARLSLSWQQW